MLKAIYIERLLGFADSLAGAGKYELAQSPKEAELLPYRHLKRLFGISEKEAKFLFPSKFDLDKSEAVKRIRKFAFARAMENGLKSGKRISRKVSSNPAYTRISKEILAEFSKNVPTVVV